MTAGMAEVIAAHDGFSNYNPLGGGESCACSCGVRIAGHVPKNWHAAHVAEELAKAGYGDVRKAFGAAADELARLPYVKPGDNGRDEYERMLAIRRGDTDKWLREKAEPHGVD